ncbi:MAG: hypothetical protein [Bacteriophage sp.]|uniref:hypothetical protein n=1 Tax=Bifidobacterium asteroides TaxID=1684 RepID=UPI0014370B72|nr:hypothetical protein [Bifidobacterium asteroides]MCT6900941.1 hypothetical protein [Bifidobacterium sp.]QHJ75956.1 MAG: hypothetical protein [Bacteriophage sp.]QYN61020.1 hypothetical protein GYM67_08115 [Bifidobacterium asteroides]
MSDPKHSAGPAEEYKPLFSERTRTAIYIVAMALVIIGSGVHSFANPALGDWLTTVGGYLAAGFGVVYNPMRMAGK